MVNKNTIKGIDFPIKIISEFKSKKNTVYKGSLKKNNTEKECVIKLYEAKDNNKNNEMFWLDTLYNNGVKVPKLYYKGENSLILEYISGYLLIEEIEKYETEQNFNYYVLCSKIINWFDKFYKTTYSIKGSRYILYDINLRNFIVAGDELYGIDFEDCKEGNYEQDLGRLCAFILTYEPKFTPWKINFAKDIYTLFVDKLKLDVELSKQYLSEELDNIQKRRKICILDRKKDIIMNQW